MSHSVPLSAFDASLQTSSEGVPVVEQAATHVDSSAFLPLALATLAEAGVSQRQAEELVLKSLLTEGPASGWSIAEKVALPFQSLEHLLKSLKAELLVVLKAAAAMGDFVYELTDLGRERARRYFEHCSYCGAASVPLEVYHAAVAAQSVRQNPPTLADVRRAFADLVLAPQLVERLGEAMTAGLGFFLYGPPGNGKTSIAERVTAAYGTGVWIPRTISASGEMIQLFDAACHEVLPTPELHGVAPHKIDRRWVYVRRPTIFAGGEMTLDQLEVARNATTGIHEATLQLKSNCGTLVIDDFGRQKIGVEQLLNRWILPLERRYDLLSLSNGKTLRVPFDQLIVFATNFEPRLLVDEAFLRRIPYKVDVLDPTEDQFRAVWRQTAESLGIQTDDAALEHLLEHHYRQAQRPLRFCHARDLLAQVHNHCRFRAVPSAVTTASLEAAVQNYFAVA